MSILALPTEHQPAVDHAVVSTVGYVEAQMQMLPGGYAAETAYLAALAAELEQLAAAPPAAAGPPLG